MNRFLTLVLVLSAAPPPVAVNHGRATHDRRAEPQLPALLHVARRAWREQTQSGATSDITA